MSLFWTFTGEKESLGTFSNGDGLFVSGHCEGEFKTFSLILNFSH